MTFESLAVQAIEANKKETLEDSILSIANKISEYLFIGGLSKQQIKLKIFDYFNKFNKLFRIMDASKKNSYFEMAYSSVLDDFNKNSEFKLPNTVYSRILEGVPDILWSIDTLIPESGIAYFSGAPGGFKTWLAQEASVCVSYGMPFINKYATLQKKVLYLDFENSSAILKRFVRICDGKQVKEDLKKIALNNIYLVQGIELFLDSDEGISLLRKYISKTGARFIVIDSLVRCLAGDENSATDVRKVFQNLKMLFSEYPDLSILILHHNSKAGYGLNGLRGSGDISASADCVISFDKVQHETITLKMLKNRHLALDSFKDFYIKVTDVFNHQGIVFNYSNEPGGFQSAVEKCSSDIATWIKEDAIITFKTGQATDCMYKMHKHSRATVSKSLNLLSENGTIENTSTGRWTSKIGILYDDK